MEFQKQLQDNQANMKLSFYQNNIEIDEIKDLAISFGEIK